MPNSTLPEDWAGASTWSLRLFCRRNAVDVVLFKQSAKPNPDECWADALTDDGRGGNPSAVLTLKEKGGKQHRWVHKRACSIGFRFSTDPLSQVCRFK